MLALDSFRKGPKGLADLLVYAALVDEGVMLNKDGSFTSGFYFRGEDFGSSTVDELTVLSARANSALAKLGSGWLINVDSVRIPAVEYPREDRNAFPDPCSRGIDAERRAQYEKEGAHFDNIFALTLSYLTPPDINSKVLAYFVDDSTAKKKGGADLNQVLERFTATVRDVVDAFSTSLHLRQMSSDELLSFLHCCITGKTHPIKTPRTPMYIDAILGCAPFYTGLTPRIGENYICAVAINGFPGETVPGALDTLNRLPFEFRWSTRFIPLDAQDADKRLGITRKHWFQKRHGLMGLIKQATGGGEQTWTNTDAVTMASDADEAVNENSVGTIKYGFYTSVILVMDANIEVATHRAREVVKLLSATGFSSFIEDINSVECYLGSLPGHGYQNVRRPLIHTLNLADLLPLTAAWSGHETNPCPFYPKNSPPLLYAATNGSTPFRLSLHVADLGHFMLIGPPGAGKSTLLDTLIIQHFRYPKAQVFGFDLGYSMYTICEAAGGAHYDIGAENTDGMNHVGFCPLAQLETASDRAWAAEYIILLATLRLGDNTKLTLEQRNEIGKAVDNLAACTNRADQRTITHFVGTIQNNDVKEALRHYTIGTSAVGDIIDADKDALLDTTGHSRFFIFEMSNLFQLGDTAVIPVMMYIFRQIEKRVNRSVPTLIPIDEAFRSFGHPLAIAQLVKWLEVMRKENAAVGFATQNINTVLSSSVGSSILQTVQTKFLLPNPEAMSPQVARLYAEIGLNEREITNIAQARAKRDYYVVCGSDGRRMIDLGLGKLTLAFVGASGKEQAAVVRALKHQYGDDWVPRWLAQKGVSPDWVKYYRNIQMEMGNAR